MAIKATAAAIAMAAMIPALMPAARGVTMLSLQLPHPLVGSHEHPLGHVVVVEMIPNVLSQYTPVQKSPAGTTTAV